MLWKQAQRVKGLAQRHTAGRSRARAPDTSSAHAQHSAGFFFPLSVKKVCFVFNSNSLYFLLGTSFCGGKSTDCNGTYVPTTGT